MKRRVFLVGITAGISGCSGLSQSSNTETPTPIPKSEAVEYETPTPEPTPVASVSSISASVGVESGYTGAYLSVKVEADVDRTGLSILLSTSDGETLSDDHIPERRLLDGVETTRLDLPDPPDPGEYSVQVIRGDDWGGNPVLVAEEQVTIAEQEIELRDINIESKEKSYGEGYTMTSAAVTVINTGKTPVEITEVTVAAVDQESAITSYESSILKPGESEAFKTSSSFGLPPLESGTNTVTITASSGDRVLEKRTVEVTL